jgi:trehalose-phosphatase
MAILLDEHRSEVEARVDAASALVLYLDFDGTLAPIVVEPELARMPPETRTVLEELSRQEGVLVCVVSGRSLADIKGRVGLSGLVYSGNHGLEIESESLRFVHPEAGCVRAAIADMNRRVAGLPLLISGVQLEHKGLATTVHFRRADPTGRDQIRTIVASLVPPEHPDLVVTEGLMNYEIRPRLDWNKGSAVRWIHERIKDRNALAFVIGDDRSDEDAFSSLADAITIHVGPSNSTSARYYLNGQSDLGTLLSWLLERWKHRLDSADTASQSRIIRQALALKESSPIFNVRLRRAAVDRRRQASR